MKLFVIFPLVLLAFHIVQESDCHGRQMQPVSRSSVWRDPAFAWADPPKNYVDMELFCGSIHQTDHPGSNCGVCGDPIWENRPRANEVGGKWYRGIITAQYRAGQEIDVAVEMIAAHQGFMEWRLCTDHNRESQECFNEHLLQRADGHGSRVSVGYNSGWYRTKLRLPAGVRCDHCVIQWNYRAENRWGQCPNGNGALGCGPQEIFRGCSDVKIS